MYIWKKSYSSNFVSLQLIVLYNIFEKYVDYNIYDDFVHFSCNVVLLDEKNISSFPQLSAA